MMCLLTKKGFQKEDAHIIFGGTPFSVDVYRKDNEAWMFGNGNVWIKYKIDGTQLNPIKVITYSDDWESMI